MFTSHNKAVFAGCAVFLTAEKWIDYNGLDRAPKGRAAADKTNKNDCESVENDGSLPA